MKSYRDYIKATATKKDNIAENETSQLLYPTGFMYLDYINGSTSIVYDEEEHPVKMYHNVGIMNGSLNIVIGKSQTGKSTLTVKMAVGIIESWINAVVCERMRYLELNPKVELAYPLIHYIDSEHTMSADYIKKMSGYRNKELKHILELTRISTDTDLMNAVKWHCKYKEENMAMMKMPFDDIYGNPIVNYPPTIMIIDSMTMINNENAESADDAAYAAMSQMTAGARRAQMITKLNTTLVNVAKKYNIVIFEISHINQAPQMSVTPVAKQYRALKQGETIAGGERQLYLATSILRLDYTKAVGTAKASMENMGEGVTGFVTTAQFIKSKSNSKGSTTQMVYTNELGYDPFLCTMYNAVKIGDVSRSGNFYALDDYPDIKFNLRNVMEVFADHPELIGAFYDQMKKKCAAVLDTNDRTVSNSEERHAAMMTDDEVEEQLNKLNLSIDML